MAEKNQNRAKGESFKFNYILAGIIVLVIVFVLVSSILRPGNDDSHVSSITERLDRIDEKFSGIDQINDRLSSLDRQITEFQIALTERINSLESYMSQKISSTKTVSDNMHSEAVKPNEKRVVPPKVPVEIEVKHRIQYHIVKSGETLYRISLSYGLTVDELKRLNNLVSGSVIHVGQKLKVSKN